MEEILSPSERSELCKSLRETMTRVIVGQQDLIDSLLIALFAGGHLLLEGVPGVAKTLAANTLARAVHGDFKRIQFTPDLLPADLLGTSIYQPKEGTFTVRKGPIFTHILLADEINRAPAKVQSALLEIMQEKQVTIGGETFAAPYPFLVIATQNSIEQEGTYPLAEAQMDRFLMKVSISYPSKEEEREILRRMVGGSLPTVDPVLSLEQLSKMQRAVRHVHVDPKIVDYILDIIQATRDPAPYRIPIAPFIEYGSSPRGTLALQDAARARALLHGRDFVTPQDVKQIVHPVLRHRVRVSYVGEGESYTSDSLIDELLSRLPVP